VRPMYLIDPYVFGHADEMCGSVAVLKFVENDYYSCEMFKGPCFHVGVAIFFQVATISLHVAALIW
jgi:hypothetical protein